MSNFQPLEVVGRGSETQPQGSEYLNEIITVVSFNNSKFSFNLLNQVFTYNRNW